MHNRDQLIPLGGGAKARVAELNAEQLNYWVREGKNQKYVDVCQAELVYRQGGGKADAPRPQTAPQSQQQATLATVDRAGVLALCGSLDDARRATEQLAKIQEIGHLIAPTPVVGALPEGCSVMVSAVLADIKRDTYSTNNGQLGLGKTILEKLSGALGVDWDRNRRLDDATDPWYCRYQADGRVRNFDLSWRRITGTKEIDLRDNSPITDEIIRRETEKKKLEGDRYDGDFGVKEISFQRIHIQSNAETKAKLRAIRTLGIRTSYTREELAKPFFTATLVFTGRSEDPEARRFFREAIAQNFLSSGSTLFGNQLAPVQVPAAEVVHKPPPVGARADAEPDDDDDDEEPSVDLREKY